MNELGANVAIFDYDTVIGLILTPLTYNETTRDLSIGFTTASGSPSNVSMDAILLDQLGETQACQTSLVSASGTLTCNVPAALGNETLIVTISVDGVEAFVTFISTGRTIDFGDAGFFLALFMVMSLALMFVESKTMTIVGVIVGFVASSLFAFLKGGILASGGAIMWLIIAGMILIWKLNQDGQT